MAHCTTSELIEGSKHICYEITMMEQDLQSMRDIYAAEKTPLKHHINTFLNSFFVHARCIYEFLYEDKSSRFPEDIKASDFAEEKGWTKPDLPQELKAWKKEIDKRVVHLTYHRLEIEEIRKRWEVGYIHSELQKGLLEFYRWVPGSRICDALKEEKEHALKEAASRSQRRTSPDVSTFTTGSSLD